MCVVEAFCVERGLTSLILKDMVMQTPETPARDIRLVTMIACPCTSSSCSPLQIAVSEGYAAIVRDMVRVA